MDRQFDAETRMLVVHHRLQHPRVRGDIRVGHVPVTPDVVH